MPTDPAPDIFGDTTYLPKTTFSGIPYEVESLSVKEQWVANAHQTSFTCRVRAVSSAAWVRDMVGRVARASTNVLSRVAPEQNPLNPAQYCVEAIQVDQGGDPSSLSPGEGGLRGLVTNWSVAPSWYPATLWKRYRVVFQSLNYDVKTDAEAAGNADGELCRYVERQRRVAYKEQGIVGGGVVIKGTSQKLFQNGFKTVAFGDLAYTWRRIPAKYIPVATMDDLKDTVNAATFDGVAEGGYKCAPMTALFTGWDASPPYRDANGDHVVDLILRFKQHPQSQMVDGSGGAVGGGGYAGWNTFMDATGKYRAVEVQTTGGTALFYPTGDFTRLFKVA